MNKYMPSDMTDYFEWAVNNCDTCNKEKRCKHIKASMVDSKSFDVDEDCNCIHHKEIGTKIKPRIIKNDNQTNFLNVI